MQKTETLHWHVLHVFGGTILNNTRFYNFDDSVDFYVNYMTAWNNPPRDQDMIRRLTALHYNNVEFMGSTSDGISNYLWTACNYCINPQEN